RALTAGSIGRFVATVQVERRTSPCKRKALAEPVAQVAVLAELAVAGAVGTPRARRAPGERVGQAASYAVLHDLGHQWVQTEGGGYHMVEVGVAGGGGGDESRDI